MVKYPIVKNMKLQQGFRAIFANAANELERFLVQRINVSLRITTQQQRSSVHLPTDQSVVESFLTHNFATLREKYSSILL